MKFVSRFGWSWLTVAAVLALAALTMPSQLYPGDNHAIRLSAANLYLNGSIGIDYSLKPNLFPYLEAKGQIFIENDEQQKVYSRYGEMNTVLFAVAELFRRPSEVKMSPEMVHYANAQNLVLLGLLTIYLLGLVRHFGGSPGAAAVITACTIFGTFLWVYVRAQTYELMHAAFFLGVFYHFARFVQTRKPTQLIVALVFLLMMVLSKNTFFVIYPALLFALWMAGQQWRRWSALVMASGAAAVLTYIAIIYVKTGQLTLTAEGSMPVDAPDFKMFSIIYLIPRLIDYTVNFNASVLLLFPPLVLTLPFWPTYWRQHKSEATFLFISFFLTAGMLLAFNARGMLCYGPRYFVFVLPAMAVPLLYALQGSGTFKWFIRLILVLSSVFLFWIHHQFNSRPFFIVYQFWDWAAAAKDGGTAKKYLQDRNDALITWDFNRFLTEKSDHFPPLEEYMGSPAAMANLRQSMDQQLACNFYFKSLCPKLNKP